MQIFKYLQKTGKSYWREILSVFLLLLGIYFFRSQRRELSSLSILVESADNMWLLIGVVVTLFYIVLQATMYQASFAAIGARLPLFSGIELFLKRNLLSIFLPAGGISSLAYSPINLRKSGLSKNQINQASGIYAFIGLLTVFLVGLPLLLYALFQSRSIQHSSEALLATALLIAAITYVGWSFYKKAGLYQFIYKKFPKVIPAIDRLFDAQLVARQFWLTIFYSLIIEFCGVAHLFIAAKALGQPISFEASALAYVVSVLLMIVSPFLRGLGAVELVMVYILKMFGIATVHALAITIVYRLFEFWLPLVMGLLSFAWKGRYIFLRLFPSVMVFGLGIVNILSVITPPLADRMRLLRHLLPMASINASNLLVLLIGFILLLTSAFLIRGQRNAWVFAMIFSLLSLLGHIFKALDYEEALLATSVVIVLLLSAKQYRLRSNPKLIKIGARSVVLVFIAVLIFGFIGFYFLNKRHFGFDFTAYQSLVFSAKNFLLIYESDLQPRTRFGAEYIHILQALGFFAWAFFAFVLIKPIFNKKSLQADPGNKAKDLLDLYGESSVDYFKLHADKLLYFSDRYDAFVAYRIANSFAIVLEEPVCAEENKIAVLQEFDRHCHKMSLKTAFYRVDESSISYFEFLKKRKLLIGQEAVLEIENFTLEGRDKKSLRNALNSLQKKGFTTSLVPAPLSDELIGELKKVSDEWLVHYQKKEAVFSQGMFNESELKTHDVIVTRDAEGNLKAFLNIIPDFSPAECTYDLIRKTADAPGGVMDALIIELINYTRAHGMRFLNLGLVPMNTVAEPDNTAEELIQYASEKLKRFRHYTGLRDFKEKYATVWVNKYLVYENDFDLLQLPLALKKVMQPVTK